MTSALLAAMSEKEWDHQLFNSQHGLAPMLGWRLCYHVLRSKGSQAGFPDRVLARDRLIFVELKTETGKPSDAQTRWLDGLAQAGAETYLWRPTDLQEAGRILSGRYTLTLLDQTPCLVDSHDELWQPRSIWIPGHGRADTPIKEAA